MGVGNKSAKKWPFTRRRVFLVCVVLVPAVWARPTRRTRRALDRLEARLEEYYSRRFLLDEEVSSSNSSDTEAPTASPTLGPLSAPTPGPAPSPTAGGMIIPDDDATPTNDDTTPADEDDDDLDGHMECRDARKHHEASIQCKIAKSKDCDNHYASAYYCGSSASFARGLLALIYLLWLALLFQLLGTTADEYFSPALEQMSTDFGLPPRFAGVTLLALGNGAPDVSSTIHAVASKKQGYQLALGALTGAGMFVGTVVSGSVMIAANGAKAKGALLRDVSAYATACGVVVFLIGSVGSVSYGGVALLLVCYAAFVLVVLGADLWHRRPGGPYERHRRERERAALEAESTNNSGPRLTRDALASLDGASSSSQPTANAAGAATNDDDDDEPPAIELLLTLLHSVRRPDLNAAAEAAGATEGFVAPRSHHHHHHHHQRGGHADDPRAAATARAAPAQQQHVEMRNPALAAAEGYAESEDVGYEESTAYAESTGRPENYVVIDGGHPMELGSSGAQYATRLLGGGESEVEDDEDDEKPFESASNWTAVALLEECYYRCSRHVRAVALGLPWREKIPSLAELPFVFARRLTVPLTCDDAYARGPLAASCLVAPLWLAYYAVGAPWEDASNATPYLIAFAAGVCAMGAVIAKTHEGPLEGGAALGLGLFGFIVAATWIDKFADELVSLLEFFGALLGIPDVAMGLTVLALGNSIGDFSTNIAMAKKNLANMAITACFAGPTFNLLVGLGVGFATRLGKVKGDSIDVRLPAGLFFGFGCLVLNCVTVVSVGLANGGHIPPKFGYGAMAFYAVYVLVSLVIAFA